MTIFRGLLRRPSRSLSSGGGGGGGGGGPGTSLTTLRIRNNAGAQVSPNYITQPFGHVFKRGDVSADAYPQFQLTDGTSIPYTYWSRSNWPDGSWLFAGFMLRVPTTLAASAVVTLNVLNNGGAPPSSNLDLSVVAANTDIRVGGRAIFGVSGTPYSRLNTGISDGEYFQIGTGPVGSVYRVYQEFTTGTADDPQAGCWHYIYALQDSTGGLYGFRHLGRLQNGWTDVGGSRRYMFAGLSVYDAAGSFSFECSTSGSPLPFSVPLSNAINISVAAASAIGALYFSFVKDGIPVRVSSNGTLPAGLSANTGYYLRNYNNGTDVSTTLHRTQQDSQDNTGHVSITTSGTGNHYIKISPQLDWLASGPFTATSAGQYQFIQGGGTGTENQTEVLCNVSYAVATKNFGPRRFDVSYAGLTERDYFIDCWHDYAIYQDQTGERQDLGFLPGYFFQAFHTQTKAAYQAVKVHGLQQSNELPALRRDSTKNPINQTNTSTVGFGPAAADMYFRPTNGSAFRLSAPVDYTGRYGFYTYQHAPNAMGGAYVLTGRPEFYDLMLDHASYGASNIITRTYALSGTTSTYYNILLRTGTPREQGWGLSNWVNGYVFGPSTWNNVSIKDYLQTTLDSNMTFAVSMFQTGTSFAKANDMWIDNINQPLSWQTNYLQSMFLHYLNAAANSVTTREVTEKSLSMYDKIRTNIGARRMVHYADGLPVAVSTLRDMRSWDDWQVGSIWGGISWASATDTITYNVGGTYVSADGTPQNGGTFMTKITDNGGFVVGGLTQGVIYWLRDVNTSARTFKLATTSLLADIVDITNDGSNTDSTRCTGQLPDPDNTLIKDQPNFSPSSGLGKMIGVVNWAQALSVSMNPGFVSVFDAARTSLTASSYSGDALWANTSVFNV